ncbi:MAG: hypothetical protein LBU05_00600 [Bifidobacteriaceae bacterium]|jgi:hypothetical protein|nr:hypothetical protein [Bifidobacteriaceae bacterium]
MAITVFKGLACGVVAALVTSLGGVWHRVVGGAGPLTALPLGLVLGLVGVGGWAVAARALAGWAGLFGAAVGAFAAAQLTALPGPGGDLIIQGDLTGLVWALAAPFVAVAVAFLPRKWFCPT